MCWIKLKVGHWHKLAKTSLADNMTNKYPEWIFIFYKLVKGIWITVLKKTMKFDKFEHCHRAIVCGLECYRSGL